MRLSTRGRYAARIMVYMGTKTDRTPVTKQEIADAEAISVDYVGQILVKLRTAGLVASFRGKKGGFVLSRDPATVTLADVVRATEGPMELAPCREGPCRRQTVCAMQSVWQRAIGAVEKVLAETRLQDVVDQARRITANRAITYEI
jgi:Rrf2 family protein